jgi:hypothetical protein
MGRSVLAGRDSALCSLVLQAMPLMQMVEQERRIGSLSLEQFIIDQNTTQVVYCKNLFRCF